MFYWIFQYLRTFFSFNNIINNRKQLPSSAGVDVLSTKYENKYKIDKLRSKHQPCTNSFLLENCPVGNVLLKYNTEKSSFEYYSDRTVPFRYLETIARKYSNTFDCTHVYVTEKTKTSCNRYSHMGKLNNFSFLNKSSSAETKKLTFAAFKASMASAAAR